MLADPEVREGIKRYTAWPTIPQASGTACWPCWSQQGGFELATLDSQAWRCIQRCLAVEAQIQKRHCCCRLLFCHLLGPHFWKTLASR